MDRTNPTKRLINDDDGAFRGNFGRLFWRRGGNGFIDSEAGFYQSAGLVGLGSDGVCGFWATHKSCLLYPGQMCV